MLRQVPPVRARDSRKCAGSRQRPYATDNMQQTTCNRQHAADNVERSISPSGSGRTAWRCRLRMDDSRTRIASHWLAERALSTCSQLGAAHRRSALPAAATRPTSAPRLGPHLRRDSACRSATARPTTAAATPPSSLQSIGTTSPSGPPLPPAVGLRNGGPLPVATEALCCDIATAGTALSQRPRQRRSGARGAPPRPGARAAPVAAGACFRIGACAP